MSAVVSCIVRRLRTASSWYWRVASPFHASSVRGQLAQHLRRNAGDERARRHLHPGLDERERGDHRPLADHRVVVHDRVHADERVGADAAGMEDRAVADVAARLDHRVLVREAVDDAAVLEFAPSSTTMRPKSPRRLTPTGPMYDAGADDHVADQRRRRMHERRWVHHRRDAVDRPDLHHGERLHLNAPDSSATPVLRLRVLIAAAVTTQAAAFDLQGHRGARGLAPENTLPAFARALVDRRDDARAGRAASPRTASSS